MGLESEMITLFVSSFLDARVPWLVKKLISRPFFSQATKILTVDFLLKMEIGHFLFSRFTVILKLFLVNNFS